MRELASEEMLMLRKRRFQAEALIARRLLATTRNELSAARARTASVGELEERIEQLKSENEFLHARLRYVGVQAKELRQFVAQSTRALADAVMNTDDFATLAVEFRDSRGNNVM